MAAAAAATLLVVRAQAAVELDGLLTVDAHADCPPGKLTVFMPPAPLLATWVPQAASALDACFPLTVAHPVVPEGREMVVAAAAGAGEAAEEAGSGAVPQDDVGLDLPFVEAGHVVPPAGTASVPASGTAALALVWSPAASAVPGATTAAARARLRLSAAARSRSRFLMYPSLLAVSTAGVDVDPE